MRKLVYILLTLLLCNFGIAHAQQVVHKVSKQVSKKYPAEINELTLIGEKAAITIIGWDKNFIEIKVSFISRNTDRQKAVEEINFIKFEDQKKASELILKNYFDGKSTRITGNLSTEYQISMPRAISLNLQNLYGKIELRNLNNKISSTVSFGSIDLQNCNGAITIQNNYSNLTGNQIIGSLTCRAQKSDIKLINVDAEVNIESKYGEINLQLSGNQHPVDLNCHRSAVIVFIPKQAFNYQLKTLNNTITIPNKEVILTDQYQFEVAKNVSTININTSYCPINISYEKP